MSEPDEQARIDAEIARLRRSLRRLRWVSMAVHGAFALSTSPA